MADVTRAREVLPGLFWVGVFDRDLRVFDIVMRTPYGTTYNAFLLKTDRGTVLFETVKVFFQDEFLAKIADALGPDGTLDYIVLDHAEPDHSGSLVAVLERYPGATVIATPAALANIKHIGHITAQTKTLASSQLRTLDLGNVHLKFLMTPFLHWPDTMVTAILELRALMTCDVFGAHFCDPRVFDAEMHDRASELDHAFHHYFECIMRPFAPFVLRGMDTIEHQLGFPFDELQVVCCGHGPVLRERLREKLELYASVYGYTKAMAEHVRRGVEGEGVTVVAFDVVDAETEAVMREVQTAQGLVIGSNTIMGDAVTPIYDVLGRLNQIVHQGKVMGVFGSYGWSGEGVTNVEERLKQLKVKQPVPPLRVQLKPTQEQLDACVEWGRSFAQGL